MSRRRRSSKSSSSGSHGYPRPLLGRANWTSLNGKWDFAIDAEAAWASPDEVRWDRKIEVPFAPETELSGVGETGFFKAVWYRRAIERPRIDKDQRAILHFGAVDYNATVWVNGQMVATHEGGYTTFCADITEQLTEAGKQTIIVRAQDDPHDLEKPRGKQDWRLEPHSIWYPRTTGIWQTVWMEVVPQTRIEKLKWTADMAGWGLGLEIRIVGPAQEGLRLRVRLHSKGETIVEDIYSLSGKEVSRKIVLPDPGIDDLRNELLWSPRSPNLIDAEIELLEPGSAGASPSRSGKVLDSVTSYTAMRQVTIDGDRFVLNGRPMMLRFLLDQGYWPESGLTAPNNEAFVRDIEDGGDRARCEPSVHRGVGAVQRVVGRAGADAGPGAAGFCHGDLSLDESAGPNPAGDRERRLGDAEDRHRGDSRLRAHAGEIRDAL